MLNVLNLIIVIVTHDAVFVLWKYTLRYLGVRNYNFCNLLSNGSVGKPKRGKQIFKNICFNLKEKSQVFFPPAEAVGCSNSSHFPVPGPFNRKLAGLGQKLVLLKSGYVGILNSRRNCLTWDLWKMNPKTEVKILWIYCSLNSNFVEKIIWMMAFLNVSSKWSKCSFPFKLIRSAS